MGNQSWHPQIASTQQCEGSTAGGVGVHKGHHQTMAWPLHTWQGLVDLTWSLSSVKRGQMVQSSHSRGVELMAFELWQMKVLTL